jgi:hypothetical protein
MPKANLAPRLDLAPQLNRPLQIWNPLDYLRLLFWVFYFPQALRWYVNRFSREKLAEANMSWSEGFKSLRFDSIQRNLIFQGVLLTIIPPILLGLFLEFLALNINWETLEIISLKATGILDSGYISGLLEVIAFSAIASIIGSILLNPRFGIALGLTFSILGSFSLGILPGASSGFSQTALPWDFKFDHSYFIDHKHGVKILLGLGLGWAFGMAFNAASDRETNIWGLVIVGCLGGSFLGLTTGFMVSLRAWTLGNTITFEYPLDILQAVLSSDWQGAIFAAIAGGFAGGIMVLRPDSWFLGSFLAMIYPKSASARLIASTYLKSFYIHNLLNSSFQKNWNSGIYNSSQALQYLNQTTSTLNIIRAQLNSLDLDHLIRGVALFLGYPHERRFMDRILAKTKGKGKGKDYLHPAARAAVTGFWHLHQAQPTAAAQAFAVVRDIRHGDEMHGLASLLALFDATKTAEQIAAIDLPNLPEDLTLRPNSWEAIRRFCHVVSDTKTVQASASRSARAFATNRALGELQHILAYEADLPKAERFLVVAIAKTWRNALLEITAEVGESAITQPVRNPYVIGDPVEGSLFVGREDIMRQLQELWLMDNPLQSVVIYGHRRMGKTSILKNVARVLGSGLRVAYVNLLKSAGADHLSDVLLAMSDQVAAVMAIPPPSDVDMVASPARTFERFLRRAIATLAEGEGLIIALDEFEKIEELIEAGKLEASFLAYLRGLVQDSPRVGFAFAGLHTLEEMSADYFQPFFASVIPIKVDFFKPATVRALLPNPGDDFPLDYSFDALDCIWELTAGQPYLTQLVGFHLVRRYNDQVFERHQKRDAKFTAADVQAVVNQPEFFAQGKPYFAGVWAQAHHSNDAPGQQSILKALAPYPQGLALTALQRTTGLDSAAFAAALSTLENHDVIRRRDGKVSIIVELFRRWVE